MSGLPASARISFIDKAILQWIVLPLLHMSSVCRCYVAKDVEILRFEAPFPHFVFTRIDDISIIKSSFQLVKDRNSLGLQPCFRNVCAGVGNEVLDDPTDLINLGIDSPLIEATEDKRPL